jgi:tetratricopeptide (TPR) repeat protein
MMYWLRYIVLIFNLFVLIFTALGKDGDGQAGLTSPFTDYGFGARAMGLGNAYVALAEDATAVFWNPAGLDYIYQQNVTLFHSSLYEGTLYDYFGYAYPTLNLGTFGLGIARLSTGDILYANEYNYTFNDSKFSFEKYRLYLGYGLKLPYDLAAGLSIKLERSGFFNLQHYDYGDEATGIGVGLDAGVIYRPRYYDSALLRDWSVGLSIINLFPMQLREGDVADVYPMTFTLGIMRKFRVRDNLDAMHFLLDLQKTPKVDFGVRFGVEYNFQDIGMLRLGFNGESPSFGAGVKYSIFQIDYAFANPSTDGLLPPTHRISLSFNFGMNRDEMFEIVEARRRENEAKIIAEMREADKQAFIAEHLQNADEYFEAADYFNAVVEYQQVISADPFHERSLIMMDSSRALIEKEFQERQNQAVQEAVDKTRAAGDSAFIAQHFAAGQLALDQKDYTQALIEFNLALERDPGNQSILAAIDATKRSLNNEVRNLITRARQESQDGNFSEALRVLARARMLSSDDPQIDNEINNMVGSIKLQENIQKGLKLYDIGEYEQALEIFEEVLAMEPDNQFIKRYYDRSRAESAGAEKMGPDVERRYLEGVDRYLAGKYQEAIDIWQELFDQYPNRKILDAINGAKERLRRAQE